MNKDSFIFYKEWKDAIEDLSADVRLEIYEAIIEYGTTGKLPKLKPIASIAFNFIKKRLDVNHERYNEVIERRREAGKKGGLAKASKGKQELANLANASKGKQELANLADNDNDNDIKENTTNVVSKKDAARAATLQRREQFKESLMSLDNSYHASTLSAFFNYWSELNKSGTKMRYEMQDTWELSKRLVTWFNRENKYDHEKNRKSNSKQEANEYAVQLLNNRLEQRENGFFREVPKPF